MRTIFKHRFAALAAASTLSFASAFAEGASTIAPQDTSLKALESCTNELTKTYFRESFVNETLKKFNVPEDKWAQINKDLAEKEKGLAQIVQDKAAKMDQNPLGSSETRPQALKLFREALVEAFQEVMHNAGITDDEQIKAMLADIQKLRIESFGLCIKKVKEDSSKAESGQLVESEKQPANLAKDDDKDDKDDDEDDDSDDNDSDEDSDDDKEKSDKR